MILFQTFLNSELFFINTKSFANVPLFAQFNCVIANCFVYSIKCTRTIYLYFTQTLKCVQPPH